MDMNGKRFLVIGGAGLIGSHTIDQLLQNDVSEIVIYDNFVRGTNENLANALKDPRVKILLHSGSCNAMSIPGRLLK
jgi:UDP-glucose 4-epimerase